MTTPGPVPSWKNRIVESGEVPAAELHANPANARKHPAAQRAALKGVLNEVGWVARVVVNRTTGLILDGHLRVEEAAKRGETVPVDYLDLTAEEEAKMLALLDPIGAMAKTDEDALASLFEQIQTTDPNVVQLIEQLTPKPLKPPKPAEPKPSDLIPKAERFITTQYKCPSCQHEWTGNPHS